VQPLHITLPSLLWPATSLLRNTTPMLSLGPLHALLSHGHWAQPSHQPEVAAQAWHGMALCITASNLCKPSSPISTTPQASPSPPEVTPRVPYPWAPTTFPGTALRSRLQGIMIATAGSGSGSGPRKLGFTSAPAGLREPTPFLTVRSGLPPLGQIPSHFPVPAGKQHTFNPT
jgi:hypothetical protein